MYKFQRLICSETLDEGNPWFCPKCQKSQCASKTLSICQAPPYLIVYLKRWVCFCVEVSFFLYVTRFSFPSGSCSMTIRAANLIIGWSFPWLVCACNLTLITEMFPITVKITCMIFMELSVTLEVSCWIAIHPFFQ
jgi:hypothetical protein